MKQKIPKRLRKEPLIEAIWQLQFEPAENQPIAEILPGILFTALREEEPNLRLNRLPAADIPPFVAQNDPNLRLAAKYRIESSGSSSDSSFIYQVGDRVVTVNCRRPYVGWERFKAEVIRIAKILSDSNLIVEPKRHSLRYIDLITLESPPSLSFLRMALTIGDHPVQERPLQLRVELLDNDCEHILQIVTPAQVNIPDIKQAGAIIDLETHGLPTEQGLADMDEDLEVLHRASKVLFFTQVLAQEAIDKMEPEY